MMADNWKRLNIWLALEDRFNYTKFVEQCVANNCAVMEVGEFIQKAGIISYAISAYPDKQVWDAYLHTLHALQTPAQRVSFATTGDSVPTVSCGSCGGGQVK